LPFDSITGVRDRCRVSQSTETAKEANMKDQVAKSWVKVLTLAVGIACSRSASGQTFKHVVVQGGATLTQIASGGASVWALASNQHPYIMKNKQFVLANNISLTQIVVGGGNSFQPDTVWGLNSAGSIYHAHLSGTTWVFSRVSGLLDVIAVGLGYQDSCHRYEVWGLNTGSQIYRYNFCTSNFEQQPGFLCQIQVGGGDIWGTDCGPNISRFNFSKGVFDQINSPFASFPTLTVGPNGVWALGPVGSSDPFPFQFDDQSQSFFFMGGGAPTQVQAGGNGLWAIDSSQQIFRFEPSKRQFVQIPGVFVSVSVGSGGGVWAIDGFGQAYAFSTP
jgi:hypothetical protein